MDYIAALSYLYSLGNEVLAMKFGLDTIKKILAFLDNPHNSFKSILVAGTNGKGSTCAMLASILEGFGLKVGLYTSPHLVHIEERIRVNGQSIPSEKFAEVVTEIYNTINSLLDSDNLVARPTFFEHMTLAAFLYFQRQNVDVAILEVGMGGRLDATNVVTPEISVITNISYDHQKYLGNTLTEITFEKAAIMRPFTKSFVASTQPLEVIEEIRQCSYLVNSYLQFVKPLEFIKQDSKAETWVNLFGEVTKLPLLGQFQSQNAALAIEAASNFLQLNLANYLPILLQSLSKTYWPGRMELIVGSPSILLDGAHNLSGAEVLTKVIRQMNHSSTTLVFGAMTDKPVIDMLALLREIAKNIVIVPVDNLRSFKTNELREIASKFWPIENIQEADSFAVAFSKAKNVTDSHGLIVIAGSIYLVGEAISYF